MNAKTAKILRKIAKDNDLKRVEYKVGEAVTYFTSPITKMQSKTKGVPTVLAKCQRLVYKQLKTKMKNLFISDRKTKESLGSLLTVK